MARGKRPWMTDVELRRFKRTLQAAKGNERRRPTPAPVVYSDALLRASVVVDHGGEWWLCPRRPGGWASRQRLTMTDAAKAERLRPSRDVDAGWLGIGDESSD